MKKRPLKRQKRPPQRLRLRAMTRLRYQAGRKQPIQVPPPPNGDTSPPRDDPAARIKPAEKRDPLAAGRLSARSAARCVRRDSRPKRLPLRRRTAIQPLPYQLPTRRTARNLPPGQLPVARPPRRNTQPQSPEARRTAIQPLPYQLPTRRTARNLPPGQLPVNPQMHRNPKASPANKTSSRSKPSA